MRMTLYDYCAERDELVLLTQWAIYSRAGPQKCGCSRLRRESQPQTAGTLSADAGRMGIKWGRSARIPGLENRNRRNEK